MAFERERHFLRSQTRAIIAHADQTETGSLDIDLDAVRTGIERILVQFLDDRGRALDDLAGGDLINEIRRKDPDRHADPVTDKGGGSLHRAPSPWRRVGVAGGFGF
jgi:hypothetical protein